MTDSVLSLEGVGKYYRLGGIQPYQTLRDNLAGMFSRQRGPASEKDKGFWALRDISFGLKEGEVLGIVGRNGAGKSTLLKLLSRITTPDEGRISVRGRIGSLLEVGTGFHPELTGRENVFMNGILLGMTHREVARKFDEIVAFSGVEEFLDTPVKRYSSGMRVRLGFAVAAHLDPEILVIDEVLAVGDAEFQRKCLGRMNTVASEGRTVLFVSHQMDAILSLCTRAIWLESGRMKLDGLAEDVVPSYLSSATNAAVSEIADRQDRSGEGKVRIVGLTLSDESDRPLSTGRAAIVKFSLASDKPIKGGIIARFAIRDNMDRVITLLTSESAKHELMFEGTHGVANCTIPKLPLMPGDYSADVSLWQNGYLQDKINRAIAFTVMAGNYSESGKDYQVGLFHLDQDWSAS
ncbi:lipopolysaccharide transport system ATP-binding protein [Polaromonas sp. YR568]|uniref:ABC transporter ATP-binding protein n=1 Tax=Polaromonas sp. YR568 TaxID=1855301 RepID=UPI0008ECD997|nr:ABC transporter ATP-binding protein [Polaromonas sp. YR568]SFU91564.1 lipopolysaccharide transport system ATP-binding protein [Polaromonas sp. YR568]